MVQNSFFFNKTALADGEGLFSGCFKTCLGKKVPLVLSISRSPTCNYCVGTKTNSSSIKAHKPPVLFARRRSTLESFSKHHFMKLRQHFHALVYDRMKVFQNYFLSSARKKVNKKKRKERKKNWTFRWQGGKIVTLKTLRTNDLILVLSICNYCARKK